MSTRRTFDKIVAVLGNAGLAEALDDAQWSELIVLARSANLLGALAERLASAHQSVRAQPARHLDGARQLSSRQRQSVLWEVHQLQAALGSLNVPVLLLKGAAYVMAYDLVAKGRLFGDLDILVPKSSIGDVESQLMLHGWVSAKTNAYDQRYYRQWMHEIPPMQHIRRGTVVDVHHTILPPTARHSPDPARIVARSVSVKIGGLDAIRVPCPEDLVIHSITHLVHEGELHNGLRDLHDIDCMLRSFQAVPGFWDRLSHFATENDLAQPVLLGLHLVELVFKTPIPAAVTTQLAKSKNVRRPPELLQSIYLTALQPQNHDLFEVTADLARWLIYVRSHALRMPPWQLARHLTTKAWMGLMESWRTKEVEKASTI